MLKFKLKVKDTVYTVFANDKKSAVKRLCTKLNKCLKARKSSDATTHLKSPKKRIFDAADSADALKWVSSLKQGESLSLIGDTPSGSAAMNIKGDGDDSSSVAVTFSGEVNNYGRKANGTENKYEAFDFQSISYVTTLVKGWSNIKIVNHQV